jgi:hypothetical protein
MEGRDSGLVGTTLRCSRDRSAAATETMAEVAALNRCVCVNRSFHAASMQCTASAAAR